MKRKKIILALIIGIVLVTLMIPNTEIKENSFTLASLIGSLMAIDAQGLELDRSLLKAEAAVLLDQDTGIFLFNKNERKRMYPASTTKMLTALLAIEKGRLDELVTVGQEVNSLEPDESRAGLVPGQQLLLYDLINAMMLPSGNDAARTIALYIARKDSRNPALSIEEGYVYFAQLMNQRARQAGAVNSYFVNPHGLHDDQHYTTAEDLALIASAAMENEIFRQVVQTDFFSSETTEGAIFTFTNRNKLLQENSDYFFTGTTGIKTGFTDQAGYCLVSSATREGKNVIAVVLKSTDLDVWQDSQTLLEYGLTDSFVKNN